MKQNTKKTLLIIGVIVMATIVAIAIILTTIGVERGGSGEHYDFDCLTTPVKKPLNECKEN